MSAQSRPVLLLTRPAEASARFAAQMRARFGAGLVIVTAPLIAPRFLAPALPGALTAGRVRGLIFTSATGAAAFARISADRSLPAFCVGTQTRAQAQAQGWQAQALGGDAAGLAAALLAGRGGAAGAGPLLHARGVHAAGDLAAQLSAAGVETEEIIVYDQIEQPLTPEARALLDGGAPVIVPLFSPRSAALFVAQAAQTRAPILPVALSRAVADAVSARFGPVETAVFPDAEAMLGAIGKLLSGPSAA